MTREELIRNLKYTMEKHKNVTSLTFGTNISVMCKDILDYLEQEPKTDVLNKIRAEITNIHLTDTDGHNNNWYREPQAIINDALRIIDKYKAESEG